MSEPTKEQIEEAMILVPRFATKRLRVKINVENAVYGHIRAKRSLGHTTANSAEIASALSLTVADVNRAFASLKSKGVKVIG